MYLATPFLAQCVPNGMKYGPKKKLGKYLTFEGKEVFLPFISKASPNVLHRIEKMQEMSLLKKLKF